MKFNAFGTNHSLKLEKNNFLSDNFKAYHHRLNKVTEVPYEDCYYISENAAFRSCNGLTGSFYSSELNTTVQIEHHFGKYYNITKKHARTEGWCSSIANATNVTETPIELDGVIFKRDGGAVVEILALGDYSLVNKYGNKTVQFILDSVNVASSIYAAASLTIQLSLSLNAVITFNTPIISNYGEDAILDQYFPDPKFDYLRNVDHFTFITATAMIPLVNITNDYDSIVGSAKFNAICTVDSVSVVSEYSISGTGPTGYAIAHEIAHSLGSLHDGDNENGCSNAGNVMSPSIQQDPLFNKFSSCSKVYITNTLGLQLFFGGCLFNPSGSPQIDPNTLCGNGIVDFGAGEECDASGDSACCDIHCKLKVGATCDDSNGACCHNCTLLTNQQTCRNQTDPFLMACDSTPVSFCDGISPYCPIDHNSPDGLICTVNSDQGFCSNGYCFTKAKVCDAYIDAFYNSRCDPNNDCIIKCDTANGNCGNSNFAMSDGSKCGAALDGVCSNMQCILPPSTLISPVPIGSQVLSTLVRKSSALPNNMHFTNPISPSVIVTTLLPTQITGQTSNTVAPLSATGAVLIVIAVIICLVLAAFGIFQFYTKKAFVDNIELQAVTSDNELQVLLARTLKEDD